VNEGSRVRDKPAGRSSQGARVSATAWSVAEAKGKLSEILRRAREGEPQTIGAEDPCVVVSASDFQKYWRSEHLGKFLVESAPRGCEFELPSRAGDRGDPFAPDKDERAA
jgi:prevent-host-death family protein